MVLGFNINRIVIFLNLFIVSSCAISSTSADSDSITTVNSGQTCSLLLGNVSYNSSLKSPCTIAEYKGNLQYVKVKKSKVYVLVGKPASKKFLSNWNVSNVDKCSDQAQGFTIENNQIKYYERILKNTLICPYKYLDEKLIYTLAR